MNRRPWLTLENRRTIEELNTGRASGMEIATRLQEDRSVIYRELRRGRTGNADKNGRPEYKAEVAQEKAYWNQERLKQEV